MHLSIKFTNLTSHKHRSLVNSKHEFCFVATKCKMITLSLSKLHELVNIEQALRAYQPPSVLFLFRLYATLLRTTSVIEQFTHQMFHFTSTLLAESMFLEHRTHTFFQNDQIYTKNKFIFCLDYQSLDNGNYDYRNVVQLIKFQIKIRFFHFKISCL